MPSEEASLRRCARPSSASLLSLVQARVGSCALPSSSSPRAENPKPVARATNERANEREQETERGFVRKTTRATPALKRVNAVRSALATKKRAVGMLYNYYLRGRVSSSIYSVAVLLRNWTLNGNVLVLCDQNNRIVKRHVIGSENNPSK